MKRLLGDQDHVRENLVAYVQGFSPAVRDIFEGFEFHAQLDRLAKADLLYLVAERFAGVDLHPAAVPNAVMGDVFEELIRKFAELSNETAGEHFTPREVIRLMVDLLFAEDDEALSKPGVVRTLYDPTAGTGGMLSVAEEHLRAMNPGARLVMYGQELNAESYAICQGRHAHQGAGRQPREARQHALGRRTARRAVRLHALQPAVRGGVEEDRARDPEGARSRRATTGASAPGCRG